MYRETRDGEPKPGREEVRTGERGALMRGDRVGRKDIGRARLMRGVQQEWRERETAFGE
jgi:hypothetical protein